MKEKTLVLLFLCHCKLFIGPFLISPVCGEREGKKKQKTKRGVETKPLGGLPSRKDTLGDSFLLKKKKIVSSRTVLLLKVTIKSLS